MGDQLLPAQLHVMLLNYEIGTELADFRPIQFELTRPLGIAEAEAFDLVCRRSSTTLLDFVSRTDSPSVIQVDNIAVTSFNKEHQKVINQALASAFETFKRARDKTRADIQQAHKHAESLGLLAEGDAVE